MSETLAKRTGMVVTAGPVVALRVPDVIEDMPDGELPGLTPGDFIFFQRWGYRKLALQMIMGEAKTLAGDPQLLTSEGKLSHEWVTKGNIGLLPFDTCVAWMGLYDFDGQYLDEVVRQKLLTEPEAFVRALKQCEGLLESAELKGGQDAMSETMGPSMALSERIELVYADDDISIGSDGDFAGAPIRMGFAMPVEHAFERPGWRSG